MDAWHVLNSDLKKSLGFVSPFFCHHQQMWKHESGNQPAYYNAVDAATAGMNMRGTLKLLKQHGMWDIYNEFICELDPVFSAMTRAGMPVDLAQRVDSSKKLITRRDHVRTTIESIIPQEIKVLKPPNGYVRPPADTNGMVEVIFNAIVHQECSNCGERDPKKSHFKSTLTKSCTRCGGKWTAAHIKPKRKGNNCEGAEFSETQLNPCVGASSISVSEGEKRWARVEPFKASTKGVQRYQKHFKHPLIYAGKGADKKVTTDEKAIKKLIGQHPADPFYPLVLEDREYTKLGGTYIGWFDNETGKINGGFPVGRDGAVHGHFRHTPSTLRSSMVSPNLQNLPRGDAKDAEAVANLVKQMFVCPPGYIFVARDFSGIEAVNVGVAAGDRDFFRLAKIDIHSYFTGHNLVRLGVLGKADMPSTSWSDEDLAGYGAFIKKKFKAERDVGKRCIHAGNYRVGPRKLNEEYPQWFPKVKDAAAVLNFFYEVFPAINAWHERICLQVDKTAVIKNSFGHAHRFYSVLNWTKKGSQWEWGYGDDAKRLIAFGPQSDAALTGKRALKRCYYNYPDSMAQWLRLFIHDEIFVMCPIERADEADRILQHEMEQPIPEMILDPAWGYGDCLTIASEGKRGYSWGSMH